MLWAAIPRTRRRPGQRGLYAPSRLGVQSAGQSWARPNRRRKEALFRVFCRQPTPLRAHAPGLLWPQVQVSTSCCCPQSTEGPSRSQVGRIWTAQNRHPERHSGHRYAPRQVSAPGCRWPRSCSAVMEAVASASGGFARPNRQGSERTRTNCLDLARSVALTRASLGASFCSKTNTWPRLGRALG